MSANNQSEDKPKLKQITPRMLPADIIRMKKAAHKCEMSQNEFCVSAIMNRVEAVEKGTWKNENGNDSTNDQDKTV